MSLLDKYTVPCVTLTKTWVDDPIGGYNPSWTEGAHFDAAWEYQDAPEVTVAEQQGVSRVYRLYVHKDLQLDYHEVIRREDNGQTYRVTNPGTDRVTPVSSRINRRLIEVEQYPLPGEE